MDEDQIADLKQFIASLIAQQTSTIREEVRSDIRTELKEITANAERLEKKIDATTQRVERKIDDLSAAVAEAMDANSDANESRFKDHEKRIRRLERQAQPA